MDDDALNRLPSLDSVCDDLVESERQDRARLLGAVEVGPYLQCAVLCVWVDAEPNRQPFRQLDAG